MKMCMKQQMTVNLVTGLAKSHTKNLNSVSTTMKEKALSRNETEFLERFKHLWSDEQVDKVLHHNYPDFMAQLDAYSKDPEAKMPALPPCYTIDQKGMIYGRDPNLMVKYLPLVVTEEKKNVIKNNVTRPMYQDKNENKRITENIITSRRKVHKSAPRQLKRYSHRAHGAPVDKLENHIQKQEVQQAQPETLFENFVDAGKENQSSEIDETEFTGGRDLDEMTMTATTRSTPSLITMDNVDDSELFMSDPPVPMEAQKCKTSTGAARCAALTGTNSQTCGDDGHVEVAGSVIKQLDVKSALEQRAESQSKKNQENEEDRSTDGTIDQTIDDDAMEEIIEKVIPEFDDLPKPGCDEWDYQSTKNRIWVMRSPTAAGKDYNICSSQTHARVVVVKMFKTVLKPVLRRLNMDLPDNFCGMSQNSMADFLKKYNKKIDEYKKENPNTSLLCTSRWHSENSRAIQAIISLAYRLGIPDAGKLKNRKGSAETTYGETLIPQMQAIVNDLKLGNKDVFVDMGSGVGQLVNFTAAYAKVKKAVGIEVSDPADKAPKLQEEFKKLMDHFGMKPGFSKLIKDTFLDEKYKDLITKEATVIFINNLVFGPKLTAEIVNKLLVHCRDGTRIVSTTLLGYNSQGFRNLEDDFDHRSDHSELTHVKGGVSWTNSDVKFHVTVVNNKKLEKKRAEKMEVDKKAQRKKEGRNRKTVGSGNKSSG